MSNELVVQVLVEGEDVVSGAGLAATRHLEEVIASAVPPGALAEQPDRPAVVHWLTPVAPTFSGPDDATASVDDERVSAALGQLLEGAATDEAALVTGLLPDDASASGTVHADAGLMLVFLDAERIAPDHLDDVERWEAMSSTDHTIARAVREAALPDGYTAEAFSFPLLFGDEAEIQTELGRLFGGAFGLIVLILAFVYWVKPTAARRRLPGVRRTVADVVLTMATLLAVITWTEGIGVLLGPGYLGLIGPFNDLTQVVPVLMIGLGVDYGIHLTNRYRQELGAARPPAEAIGRAAATVGVALALATVTTAVGFLTNLFNPVPALGDFGVMAAVGIAASFLLMLTFVPAIRSLLDRRAERRGTLHPGSFVGTGDRLLPRFMSRLASPAVRLPVVTLIVTLALGGSVGAWGMARLEVRFSQADFVPEGTPAVAVYDEIFARFGGGFGETTEVLATGDVATPEAHNALAAVLEGLADVPHVATLGDAAQVASPHGLLAARLSAPGSEELQRAAAEAGLRDDLTVADGADVVALYDALVDDAPEPAAALLSRGTDGGYDALRLAVQTRAGEAGAAFLRDELRSVFEPLTAAGVTAVATSDQIVTDVVATALADSQLSSLLVTLVAAMALLALTYWWRERRPALGVLTVLPVALVVLWTFAMMAATDIPFGPLTATIAALAIGIGVPYTVHITNRYLEERARRVDAAAAVRATLRDTGGSLAGSAFTTCAGFGILATASLPAFRQFGLVTVYAIAFALVAATLVLPSLLVLWDRWHARRQRTRRTDGPTPTVAADEVGSVGVDR